MGCDIHMYVEYKKPNTNGQWECGELFAMNNSNNADLSVEVDRVPIYRDRNYALFAVLADVRNNGTYECIAPPRGFPDDAANFTKEEYKAWEADAHSCSYLTLAELRAHHFRVNPADCFGNDILAPLTEALLRRASDLDYCRWYNIKLDGIRIVFWFDN